MHRPFGVVIAACAAATSMSANAAVTYGFSSNEGSFTFVSDDFVTGKVSPFGKYTSCTTPRAEDKCGTSLDYFQDDAYGRFDQVNFGIVIGGYAVNSYGYYFDKTAFQTVGTYNTDPVSARTGVLTVSQSAGSSVPELATWAMMLVGFGVVGGTMRRQRKAMISFG